MSKAVRRPVNVQNIGDKSAAIWYNTDRNRTVVKPSAEHASRGIPSIFWVSAFVGAGTYSCTSRIITWRISRVCVWDVRRLGDVRNRSSRLRSIQSVNPSCRKLGDIGCTGRVRARPSCRFKSVGK